MPEKQNRKRTTIRPPKDNGSPTRWPDFHHTGPDTLAGRYMRLFWQPIYHSADLPVGRAKPIKIMNVDYALYRGEDGQPHVVDARCPHRGMQLSAGWVEGDCIRCFYHGWKFDSSGQCVEQPAEPKSFARKVMIRSYPCQDYLGLVFAYFGKGEPPPMSRYPEFENFEGILEWDSYYRACNFFNNLENGADLTYSGVRAQEQPRLVRRLQQQPDNGCRGKLLGCHGARTVGGPGPGLTDRYAERVSSQSAAYGLRRGPVSRIHGLVGTDRRREPCAVYSRRSAPAA